MVAGRTLLGSGESDNCEKDDAFHDDDCNNGRGKMSTKSAHGLSCRPTEEKEKKRAVLFALQYQCGVCFGDNCFECMIKQSSIAC